VREIEEPSNPHKFRIGGRKISAMVASAVVGGLNARRQVSTLGERGWVKCQLSRWTWLLDVSPSRVTSLHYLASSIDDFLFNLLIKNIFNKLNKRKFNLSLLPPLISPPTL
jgi:hypothetical protein